VQKNSYELGKKQLGRPRQRWETVSKIYLEEAGEDVFSFLAQEEPICGLL
jgi:hypothetical protein